MLNEVVEAAPGDGALLNRCVQTYADAPVFKEMDRPWVHDNPFLRPLLNGDFLGFDTTNPLSSDQLASNASLIAHRILLSIYERDFVFLPRHELDEKWENFQAYYSDELRLLGEIIRPQLERYVFSSLTEEIDVSGPWTIEAFEAYFEDFRQNFKAEENQQVMTAITSARNPAAAAITYLIQLAGDFLVESSAMARNTVGNYGQLQSELFKVVIDECGYGIHPVKHSTLFERVLLSRGLDPVPHTYWQFYLPTSFYVNNYYNYICRNHTHLFRYFGAILQVETAFRVTCKQMTDMMTKVFGHTAETDYFTEHVHIDTHHSRMALENLIVPAVRNYGNSILTYIVRGFEEVGIIGTIFNNGLKKQIKWADSFFASLESDPASQQTPLRVVEFGELDKNRRWDGTRMSDVDTVYSVRSGELDLVAGYSVVATFGAGQRVRVPAGVLFALCPSPDCAYEVIPVGA
jgi:nitrosourea synthase